MRAVGRCTQKAETVPVQRFGGVVEGGVLAVAFSLAIRQLAMSVAAENTHRLELHGRQVLREFHLCAGH